MFHIYMNIYIAHGPYMVRAVIENSHLRIADPAVGLDQECPQSVIELNNVEMVNH